jgi:serine/threonine protein kinase/formylglycine-generating enzyme required for sulfatase activity
LGLAVNDRLEFVVSHYFALSLSPFSLENPSPRDCGPRIAELSFVQFTYGSFWVDPQRILGCFEVRSFTCQLRMSLTPNQFGTAVVQAGLCSADEVRGVWSSLSAGKRPTDGAGFSQVLVDRGLLTHFQGERLLQGKGSSLILGEYVLLDSIGAGGMGQVFQARHRRMDRLVAIKLLPSQMMQDEAAVKRFEREVRAAAKLSHPNIVIAFDAGHTNSQHFLVMEHVDGQDLSSYVKAHGPLSVTHAMECITQAARGLAYAHHRGVIHRDIKPANLLLDREGNVKILDMGLARLETAGAHQDELTGTGQIMGTIDFMPPEQAMDTKSADERADIYSLGITLWFLLTGRPVYDGSSMMAKLIAHREQKIPTLSEHRPDLPDSFDTVFSKMVAKSPEARYQTVNEALQDLELLYESSTTGTSRVIDRTPVSVSARLIGGTHANTLQHSSSHTEATQIHFTGQVATAFPEMEQTIAHHSVHVGTDPAIGAAVIETVSLPASETATLRSSTPLNATRPLQVASQRRFPPWLIGLGALGGGSLLAFAAMVMFFSTPNGTLRIEITDPGIEVSVKGSEILIKGAEAKDISLRPGEHSLHVKRGDFEFDTTSLVLKKGETVVVKAELLDGQMQLVSEGKVLGSIGIQRAGNWQGWPVDAPAPAIAPFDAAQAKSHQEAWASYLQVPVEYTDPIGIKFTLIPPGEFLMGSTQEEVNAELETIVQYHAGDRSVLETDNGWGKLIQAEFPRHRVILTRPFYLAVTEVTQSQFERTTGRNPSEYHATGPRKEYVENVDTSDFPVETILRDNALEFCMLLNEKYKYSVTEGYRLPTESEWEFACRAGTTTSFSTGGEIELLQSGWFANNAEDQTHPVGKLAANPFGLFDMHGNVAEYVADAYDPAGYLRFEKQSAVNPVNQFRNGSQDFLRGGFFGSPPTAVRSAFRFLSVPWIPWPAHGVRVALSIDAVLKSLASTEQAKQQRAAETIIEKGGTIRIKTSLGQEAEVVDTLPSEEFVIVGVLLDAEADGNAVLDALHGVTTVEYLVVEEELELTLNAFESINTMIGLHDLFLNGSGYVDDERFARLSNLVELKKLVLWQNGLSEVSLGRLNAFPKLIDVQLGGGQFTGHSLMELEPMPGVESLGMSNAVFEDASLPALVEKFPNLIDLNLSYTPVSLKEGNAIAGLTKLRKLILEGTLVDDAGLQYLSGMTSLQLLDIRDCPVTAAAIAKLRESLPQCKIESN